MAGLPVLVAELMKRETVGGPDGLSTCHRSKGCAIDSAKKETSGEAAVALWFRKREGGMGEQEAQLWCICTRVGGVYQTVTNWRMLQSGGFRYCRLGQLRSRWGIR